MNSNQELADLIEICIWATMFAAYVFIGVPWLID